MKKPLQLPEVRRNEDGMLMSTRDEVDARVAYVEDMMLRGEFKRGETPRALAKEWGIELKTVQRYCSLASRLCWDDSDEQREELRSQSITKLLTMADEAHAAKKWKDATGAIKVANEVAGTIRPGPAVMVNTQVNVAGGSNALPEWLASSVPDHDHAAVGTVWVAAGKPDSVDEMLAEWDELGAVTRQYAGVRR